MRLEELKSARHQRRWSQQEAAHRLGLSQSYLAMLETGERRVTPSLARRFMRVYGLAPTVLQPSEGFKLPQTVAPQNLALQLAALAYPGFAYLRPRVRKKNPAEVLLTALAQDDLEPRLVEALPWLLLRYWNLDLNWLVEQAKAHDLQNRLGFVAHLARQVAERTFPPNQPRNQALANLEKALEQSKLARLETLCQRSLTDRERQWLMENRPEGARHWNLLTLWRPEALRHVA